MEFEDAIQDETIETGTDTASEAPASRDTYTELLECELTEDERADKRKRLEDVDRELVRLDTEKKASAKAYSNQIKPLAAERESILEALDTGTEKRQVEVYEHFEPRLGKVEVRRVDTDAVVEERAMTQQELDEGRQGDLFGRATDGLDTSPEATVDFDDPSNNLDDPQELEPSPEALAQAAEDEGRVIKTNAAEVRRKRKAREAAPAPVDGDAAE
jgi:hypothetical protein